MAGTLTLSLAQRSPQTQPDQLGHAAPQKEQSFEDWCWEQVTAGCQPCWESISKNHLFSLQIQLQLLVGRHYIHAFQNYIDTHEFLSYRCDFFVVALQCYSTPAQAGVHGTVPGGQGALHVLGRPRRA